MEEKENLNRYKRAYQDDFKFTGENLAMLKWYVFKIIEAGQSKYVILEGSEAIIKDYIKQLDLPSNVEIVHDYFENYETAILFDIIEMGFILEHVDDPVLILKRFKKLLNKNGSIFIAVPNAKSLHRMLGYRAGLLDDIFKLSEYDLSLGHKRYFDLESITDLILKSDLKIIRTEGIFLKPFTTDQLKKIDLPAEIFRALYEMGQRYPEISNAILIEAEV